VKNEIKNEKELTQEKYDGISVQYDLVHDYDYNRAFIPANNSVKRFTT